jgi:hypothetical protein
LGIDQSTRLSEGPPQRCGCRWTIADGRNPVGVAPSLGIWVHRHSQGCPNPGLNSASPSGLGDPFPYNAHAPNSPSPMGLCISAQGSQNPGRETVTYVFHGPTPTGLRPFASHP